jgi:transcriptional regulator with XRE-family HTH domain
MTLAQLHERLRLELLRRIERGTLSVSLLARLTGLGQGHISNFLRTRRQLSIATLDRVLAAQRLGVEDLVLTRRESEDGMGRGGVVAVPVVSGTSAMMEPHIRYSTKLGEVPLAPEVLDGLRQRCSAARKQWDRFAAVRVSEEEAKGMEPMLRADGVVVLDRHYTSFAPYRVGTVNLYGARVGPRFVVRFAQIEAERVVLRQLDGRREAEVVEVGSAPGELASDALVGRVVMVLQGM